MFGDDDIENSQLAKTFGMIPNDSLSEEFAEMILPDDPEARNLHLIIDLALKAYKQIMDDIALIEPKNRLKYMELAEKYLGQAKDARYKLEYLAIQTKKNTGNKGTLKTEEKDDKPEGGSGVPRGDLYGKVSDIRKGTVK